MVRKQIIEKPLDPAKEQKECEENKARKLYGGGLSIEWSQPRTEIKNIGDVADDIVLEPIFQKGIEQSLEEKLKYLKEYPNILLGVKDLWYFWKNPELIPRSWENKNHVRFCGTVIHDDYVGGFWIPFIWWSKKWWQLGKVRFESDDDDNSPSAILKRSKENSKKDPKPCQAA